MRAALVIASLGLVGLGLLVVAQRFLDELQAPPGPTPPPLLAAVEEPEAAPSVGPAAAPGASADEPQQPAVGADQPSARARALAANRTALGLLEGEDPEELGEAVQLLEECCELDPAEAIFRRNLAVARAALADALVDSPNADDRARAVALLERALTDLDGEERAAMEARLERWRSQAAHEDGFFSSGNPRFELAYDGDHRELRDAEADLLERLDRAYQDLGELFGAFPLEERRLRVVLYRAEDFTRLTGLGHWAGGVFDGTIRVPIGAEGVDPRLDGVLRHELSHAFVERLGGGACPAWLNEGLAQILEERRFDRRRAEVARAALRTAPRLELADLERPFVGLGDEQRIRAAYRWSLAFVDHVRWTWGDAVAVEMATAGGDGGTPAAAFTARLGLELQAEWQRFVDGL